MSIKDKEGQGDRDEEEEATKRREVRKGTKDGNSQAEGEVDECLDHAIQEGATGGDLREMANDNDKAIWPEQDREDLLSRVLL